MSTVLDEGVEFAALPKVLTCGDRRCLICHYSERVRPSPFEPLKHAAHTWIRTKQLRIAWRWRKLLVGIFGQCDGTFWAFYPPFETRCSYPKNHILCRHKNCFHWLDPEGIL